MCLHSEKRKPILRSILLSTPPIKDIINKMTDLKKDFTSIDVGNLISIYNKKNWKPRTKYGHGTALISWLKEADIVVDSRKQFTYKISNSFSINEFEEKADLDWSKINYNEFENLCFDLLESLDEFENVKKMGGAPGDLKRDITATQRIETIFGTEYRKWVVQCKHYQKEKVNPNDLPGLTNALSTHNSEGLLVMTSSELTPNARKYLEDFSSDPKNPYKAAWMEKNKLEELIKNNQKLLNKYFK